MKRPDMKHYYQWFDSNALQSKRTQDWPSYVTILTLSFPRDLVCFLPRHHDLRLLLAYIVTYRFIGFAFGVPW